MVSKVLIELIIGGMFAYWMFHHKFRSGKVHSSAWYQAKELGAGPVVPVVQSELPTWPRKELNK